MALFQTVQESVRTYSSTDDNIKKSCDDGSSAHDSSQEIEDEPHVGTYSIVKTLEKGKFGTVKLAKHITTGEKVAIKKIDKQRTSKSEHLFREIKNMKTLDHPNIVKLLQVIETEHFLYLIMEYAEGGDLFNYLESGLMQEHVVRDKFRQIVSAVHYCHQKQIIHRDLKLENILLDSENNVKIADFGFSREFFPGNMLETYCGTAGYVAPEILQGQKYEGPEIDVWALGVILYEMLTDSLPFGELSVKNVKERVLRGKYHLPSYVSTECKNLINKILVFDPRHRASVDEIMKDEWFNMGLQEEIEILTEIGYDEGEITKFFQACNFDDCYANYGLLQPKASNSGNNHLLTDTSLTTNNATTVEDEVQGKDVQTATVSSHPQRGSGDCLEDGGKMDMPTTPSSKQNELHNPSNSVNLTPQSFTSSNNAPPLSSCKKLSTWHPDTVNETTTTNCQIFHFSNSPTTTPARLPKVNIPPFSPVNLIIKAFWFHYIFITR